MYVYMYVCTNVVYVYMPLSPMLSPIGWARWISSDLGFAYHLLQEEKTSQLLKLGESVFVHPDPSSVRDVIENAVFALENAGNEFKLSLRQILRLHKEVLTDFEDSSSNRKVEGSVLKILEKMLLVKFMPKNSSELFYRTLMDARVILTTTYLLYIHLIHSLN